ncbi:UBP-type zinc finger domain-containing protein [Winogradskyella sp.]|uniref:UBP-type zinc finger domain-containing protein n=1 Tax=Winogradskyella sp. TaxID=1883156 RepID=UPI002635C3CD|nr:UBP-type zinc finger domain-containing protein [Winogradskyella sp.]
MAFKQKSCEHLKAITTVKEPKTYECETCITTGGTWVHLRTCQTCGITLCCDSSPNQHASKHAMATQHHVIASAEPKEKWLWCYEHKLINTY